MSNGRQLIRRRPVLAALLLASLLSACSALRAPEPEPIATPDNPVWSRPDVTEHLSVLNTPPAALRLPGTRGLETAAEYLSDRMYGYRLQPVYDDAYRVELRVPSHRIEAAAMSAWTPDSVALSIGFDFLPDGRSDSGSEAARFVHIAPAAEARPFPDAREDAMAVLVDGASASTPRLQALADAGFGLILVVRELGTIAAAAPVGGAVVIQITPRTAAWLLGVTVPQLESFMQREGVALRSLARRIHVHVAASTAAAAEVPAVAGYLAGRHPELMRDLVVVASNLDSHEVVGGVRLAHATRSGVGLAAMLELARNEADVASRWTHPMRSILFVTLPGRDAEGLARFLDAPPWERDRIRALIYVGLRDDQAPEARRLAADAGIRLEVVPAPEPERGSRYMMTGERAARARSPIPLAEMPREAPDGSALLARAADAAIVMAARAHAILQVHAGLLPPDVSEAVSETVAGSLQ